MSTTLRLGFAMGGGVSLGTFCGAALTEVIKLHVLEIACALQANATPAFDAVEVDVFSGASAGCLSLALMLRGLAHQTDEELRDARQHLAEDPRHGGVLAWLDAESARPEPAGSRAARLREQLLAAQVAQDLQSAAWVEEIQFNRLVPTDAQEPTLAEQPGVLNLGAVTAIAREYLLERLPAGPAADTFPRRQILAKRVLFGASIANVTPLVNDARSEFAAPEFTLAGLTDGMRSNAHRELRVFDLVFGSVNDTAAELDNRKNTHHPYRWVLVHGGAAPANSQPGDRFSIGERSTWNMIATTAIASGAVPLAFPPVVLERWDYEYGYNRDASPSKQSGCTWPMALRGGSQRSYPFTYVDGGTFNNEPIREAFRLASFVDSRSEATADGCGDFERRIIFVDPFVSEEAQNLAVGIHQVMGSGDKGVGEEGSGNHPDKRAPFRRATLDKLLPHVGQILGAVIDEARVVEADKIYQTRQRFRLRENILDAIDIIKLPGAGTDDRKDLYEVAGEIIRECREQLESDFLANLIPTGNLDLEDELRRVIRESGNPFNLDPDQATAFCADPTGVGKAFGGWFKALLYAYVDILMDLGGKSAKARLLAISPVRSFVPHNGQLRSEPLALAGAPLGGFAGFMHEPAKAADFDAGRYCAGLFLLQDSATEPQPERRCLVHAAQQCLPLNALRIDPIPHEVLKNGLERLARRASSAVKQAHLVHLFPGLDQVVECILGSVIAGQIKKLQPVAPARRTFELWVDVTAVDRDLELDGKGVLKDQAAHTEPGRAGRWLVTAVDCYYDDRPAGAPGHQWQGYHLEVRNPPDLPVLPIYTDSLLSLADRKFCDLRLPPPEAVDAAIASGALGFECTLDLDERAKDPIQPAWFPRYATPLAL